MGSEKIVKKSQKIKMKSPVSELSAKRTDYDIPTFGFKSALIIVSGGALGTIVAPYLLSLIGVSKSLSVVIGNALITSFAIAYARFFIESKRGYCKKFWVTYAIFAVSFGIISYFWMYLNIYM
ncbi:MAG: hypothetical protein RSC24_14600 [Clostridium sp.]